MLRDLRLDMRLVVAELRAREQAVSHQADGVEVEPSVDSGGDEPRGACFHCGARHTIATPLQPLEGLTGKMECRDTVSCERRLIDQGAVSRSYARRVRRMTA